jgi:MFS family permease
MAYMSTLEIKNRNARYHITEGALYISTSALIPAQTMMPALIKRLGGNDVLVGAWPVVVYLAFFLPQVVSANYTSAFPYRKPLVIRRGLFQRIHILLLALVVALWGGSSPLFALTAIFVLYISNQASSGMISPVWMDFLAKTTIPERRGKLMGWRNSFAAAIGFVNGFILTVLLTLLNFPYNYASAIGLAFIYQMFSLKVQRKVVEDAPSIISPPVHITKLFARVYLIVIKNKIYRQFLIASAFLTISFSSVAFFTVAAMTRFDLSEATVGVFTIVMISGQIISGIFLGWLADAKGIKASLMVCAASLLLANVLALLAPSVTWFYFVFILFGINAGAEVFMRYNFAVECAPEGDRQMYVGLMNAWFAPFYLFAPLAGWLSTYYGYDFIFVISLAVGSIGIALLSKLPRTSAKIVHK